MGPRRTVPCVILYILLDLSLAIFLLGFFKSGWKFDVDLVYKFLFFKDGYDFLTDPVDFVILSALRVLLCVIAIILLLAGRARIVRALFMPVLGVAIFCYSYVLVKLLAFAEDKSMLQWPGLWMSVVWSILSAAIFAAMWYFVFTSHTLPYQRLIPSTEILNSAETDEETQGIATVHTESYESPKSKLSTWQHIRGLLRYCGCQWRWFSIGFLFLVIYSGARVFIPYFTGQVISTVVTVQSLGELVRSIVIMAALTCIATFFGGLRGGTFDYATALVNRQIRLDLFRSLVHQDIGFFDVTKSGEMVSRLTSDCQTMASTVSTNVNVFMRNGVMLIGALVFMFVISWQLAMVTFIAIPLVVFITKWYGVYYDKLSERTQNTIAKANQMAEEVLSTMRTVRSFACEERESRRFENMLNDTLKVNKKRSIAYMGYTWTNEFCDNAILVAVLFYGGHLVISKQMTGDELIKFLLYQMQLGENLYNIGYVMTGLMESVGASRKVFEYMERQPAIPLDGQERPKIQGELKMDNVHFTYPSRPNNPVLKELNLTIGAGETVALVGPSGGGKSSIVALLEHFYEPNQGNIYLDGINIKDINHWFYHQKIALVAQEPVLYDGSVRYNILYGCDWATEEDMLQASKTANVHNFVTKLDQGYDTNCGEKGVQMSGGQKQRIAIARALVRRPAVLILDEATSALDAESEALVQEALNRCAKERTVLIIAHRLSTIEKADRIAVIEGGTLAQSGSHRELMKDKEGLYSALVQRQLMKTTSSPQGTPVDESPLIQMLSNEPE